MIAGLVLLAGLAIAAALAPAARATAPYGLKPAPLSTPWTASAASSLAPLPEYPRPQLRRKQWLNLNGRWQYQQALPGQPVPFGAELAETILVPFPVQSPLSGIERGDTAGWYRRSFAVPSGWHSQHVLLNFGAVSWRASVYVNGRRAGTHQGDYGAFSLDITRLLHRQGQNELIVGFENPIGGAGEPVGKQIAGTPYGFYHTASSGIWQTVWLEPVAAEHLSGLDLRPDLQHNQLIVSSTVAGAGRGRVIAQALAGNRVVASASGRPGRTFSVPIANPHLWSPGDPYLYGLRVRLVSARAVLDQAQSYFGMRSISLGRSGGATRLLLNGRFVFQTGALDQGFWPDGIYTAPSDDALRSDIMAAKRLGYNMLRKHVKVESDRWYYWADKLGILVWQDMPNPPIANRQPLSAPSKAEFRRELSEIVEQHRSHPSIVTWVAFNEGWDQFAEAAVTRQIHRLDPGGLVDTDSGSANCCNANESAASDIRDSHVYFGPFAVPADRRASVIGEYGGVLPFSPMVHRWPGTLTSIGSPVLAWAVTPVTQLLRQQYAELTQEMQVRGLSGAVFTELGSYEQELGILSYDRRVFTMPPRLVRSLNFALIAASHSLGNAPLMRPSVPVGTTGLWKFDEGKGTTVRDASGHGHPLSLAGGAGWTRGIHGSALSVRAPGQAALAPWAVVNTQRSFTVSAWLSSRAPEQSGTAVSELGTAGSSFSLGIETAAQGRQSLSGLVGTGKPLKAGLGTWWTFAVPGANNCPASTCGVGANLRYGDGRYQPRLRTWHQVTGVYSVHTATITVYVDGIPEDVEHVFGIPPARPPLLVGAGIGDYTPSDTFIGAIDQVRTFARALTPSAVWELYRAERRS